MWNLVELFGDHFHYSETHRFSNQYTSCKPVPVKWTVCFFLWTQNSFTEKSINHIHKSWINFIISNFCQFLQIIVTGVISGGCNGNRHFFFIIIFYLIYLGFKMFDEKNIKNIEIVSRRLSTFCRFKKDLYNNSIKFLSLIEYRRRWFLLTWKKKSWNQVKIILL
jgi:hypothetical protein